MNCRFTKNELWEKIRHLASTRINSLTRRNYHTIISCSENDKSYQIEYESGMKKTVLLSDLYALYAELYRGGSLTNAHLDLNHKRLLGWSSWHAPGSAMFAVLPLLDDRIVVNRGALKIGGVS